MIKIASDIDGCLNLFTDRLIEVVEENYDVKVDRTLNDYDVLKSIDIEAPEDRHKFWLKHQDDVDKCKTFPEAKRYLDKLRQEGFHITLITARGFHISQRTEDWLKDRGISYDEIVFNAGTKADACTWKGAEIMIEDLPANINALAEKGIKVLVPTWGYNEHIRHENVVHCKSWKDIYNYIIGFYGEDAQ